MKLFIYFFALSVSLHGFALFFIETKQPKGERFHRVFLVGTKAYKVNQKTKNDQKSAQTEETDIQGDIQESQSTLPQSVSPVIPVYPSLSRIKGEEGENLVRFKIDDGGRSFAISLHLSSGYERLDQASIKAIQEAKFRDNNISDQLFELRFKFTLRE